MTAPKLHIEMINLVRATDRRTRMEAELKNAGVKANFHPAYDMQAHPREEMLTQCLTEGPWGVFQDGNMAITISHAQVWERFLETDATHCLVMEDDIFIAPELGQWISDLSWWPADADMVKLERWRGNKLKVLLSENTQHVRGRHITRLLSRHVGAAGYILTRKAAQSFLATRPFDITVDNLLFNFNASRAARALNVYQITPALIEQGNEPAEMFRKTTVKLRPKGLALLRQKIRRGYHEVAYPLPTLLKFLSGRARLHQIPYAAGPVEGGAS